MGAHEQPESAAVVDSVVRAFQSLTSDANYKMVSDVFNEVIYLKEQNNNLRVTNRSMMEDYRSFRNELEDHEKHLRDEKEALEKKIEEKDHEILELNDTKTQLSEAKDLLESQVAEKDKELATLTEAKTGLENDKDLLETGIAETEAQLAEVNVAKSKLTDEKAALESTVEEKNKELATLAEEKAALETSLADKSKAFDEVTEEKAKLTEEKITLEATVVEKNVELDGVRDEKATLTGEKEALESQVSEKEKELVDLHDVKSKLEADLTEVTEAKAKLEMDLNDATTKIDEQTKQIEEQTTKVEANAQEISSLKATVEERDTELAGVKDDLARMTTTADEAKTRGDTLESELKEMTTTAEEKAARVEALEGEVSELTKKVEETTARIETLEGELKEMTGKVDEQGAHIDTLEGDLSAMATEVDETRARVEFLETELSVVTGKAEQLHTDLTTAQSDLDNTRQDLEGKNFRLAELDALRVPLRSETEDTYVGILDTIWTSIAALVETQFRQDLEQSVLTDESCWSNLRQSEYLRPHARHIPLPQSNSPAAKQMRVAAVLAIISRALHRYIFRPVYLSENGSGDDGLVHMLRAIAVDNAAREEHTRATLLAMLPEKQKAAAAKRVSTVVREVSYAVQHLLSALQYEAFCTGLEQACKLACVQWMRIQLAQMKIEPYFGPPFDDFDWQVLPLPAFESSAEGVHLHGDGDEQEGAAINDMDDMAVEIGRPIDDGPLSPRSAGSRVVDQEDMKSFRSSPRPMTDYDGADSEVGPDEIMLVVWPSMCAVENGELESITQGLVISKDQVRAATEEVRGRGRQRPGAKRARTLSMPGRGVSGQAGKAFLSQGDGTESNVG